MELFSFSLFGQDIPVTVWTLFGLIGNICFTSRILVQWITAERRHLETVRGYPEPGKLKAGPKRSVESVPVLFWWLSLVGAVIHITYAFGRHDLPMYLGLSASLIPYIRNLRIHYRPDRPARGGPLLVALAVALCAIPLVAFYLEEREFFGSPLFLLGFAGWAILGPRFYYQWIQSETRRESVLPLMFWYLSLGGSTVLLLYAYLRGDLVFILSFLFNVVPYTRNVIILRRAKARAGK